MLKCKCLTKSWISFCRFRLFLCTYMSWICTCKFSPTTYSSVIKFSWPTCVISLKVASITSSLSIGLKAVLKAEPNGMKIPTNMAADHDGHALLCLCLSLTHTHTHTYTHAHTHAHTYHSPSHTRMHTHTYTHLHAHTHIYHTLTHACMHTHTHQPQLTDLSCCRASTADA